MEKVAVLLIFWPFRTWFPLVISTERQDDERQVPARIEEKVGKVDVPMHPFLKDRNKLSLLIVNPYICSAENENLNT